LPEFAKILEDQKGKLLKEVPSRRIGDRKRKTNTKGGVAAPFTGSAGCLSGKGERIKRRRGKSKGGVSERKTKPQARDKRRQEVSKSRPGKKRSRLEGTAHRNVEEKIGEKSVFKRRHGAGSHRQVTKKRQATDRMTSTAQG